MDARRALAAALTLLAVAVPATGCGDDEPSASQTTERPATAAVQPEPLPADGRRAEDIAGFRTTALTRCANAADAKGPAATPEAQALVPYARRALPVVASRRAALDGVDPPSSERAQVRTLLRSYDRYIGLLEGLASEQGEGEGEPTRRDEAAARVVGRLGQELQREAVRLGVETCGPLAA